MPFALVSNDVANDRLVVMPAYWFLYNMYALARNAWKYSDRDKRKERIQLLEHEYLAPDSVNEMFDAIALVRNGSWRCILQEKRTGNIAYRRTMRTGRKAAAAGKK